MEKSAVWAWGWRTSQLSVSQHGHALPGSACDLEHVINQELSRNVFYEMLGGTDKY